MIGAISNMIVIKGQHGSLRAGQLVQVSNYSHIWPKD